MLRRRLGSALLCLAALAAGGGASAQGSAAESPVIGARLLEGWQEPDGSRIAAIEIRLEAGWHTYWRVPGEVGMPPSFDWSGSRNLAGVRYEWPRPERLESFGMTSLGFTGGLVLPVRLQPASPGAPMEVSLDMSFGVCREICMSEEARVTARLLPDERAQERAAIEAALAERARTAAEAGVERVTCGIAPGPAGDTELVAEVTFREPPGREQFALVEMAGGPWVDLPESRTEGRTVVARARIGTGGVPIERSGIRVTLMDDLRVVDLRGCGAG
jgi:DsbC/DsbD-like thiol-disulfide interchange protein